MINHTSNRANELDIESGTATINRQENEQEQMISRVARRQLQLSCPGFTHCFLPSCGGAILGLSLGSTLGFAIGASISLAINSLLPENNEQEKLTFYLAGGMAAIVGVVASAQGAVKGATCLKTELEGR